MGPILILIVAALLCIGLLLAFTHPDALISGVKRLFSGRKQTK